jgi:hypothetical protein
LLPAVFRYVATVTVLSRDDVDYLHLPKLDEGWLLVNVLWE